MLYSIVYSNGMSSTISGEWINMFNQLQQILTNMTPAFSRKATYHWFVIVFIGFVVQADTLGVTSIIRALSLAPENYVRLLHFFHSSAWTVEGLMGLWWTQLVSGGKAYCHNGRMVLVGDHTKTPKGGRKIPALTTLHQDSETAAKPSFFRGHHWGCIGLLSRACDKFFAIPLWANIQEGLGDIAHGDEKQPKTVRIIRMAQQIATQTGQSAYLILDAYFSVGSVFNTALEQMHGDEQMVHVLARAKKNIVAYQPAKPGNKPKRGRPRKYGKKLRLMELFEKPTNGHSFRNADANIYNRTESVRYLAINLMWKPTRGMLRFILVESSRGRMILISSDLELDPVAAVELYCRRVTIETLFDTLKNTTGGMCYHFWSKYLKPISRRPIRNDKTIRFSSNIKMTRNTFVAIEKFVNIKLLVIGLLQVTALDRPDQVKAKANCWLRTVTSKIPSEFVTRIALAKIIKNNLRSLGSNWIMQLIRGKQTPTPNPKDEINAA